MPLVRMGGERVFRAREHLDYTVPDGFAGSILNLQPGAEYECRFEMSDPDGVSGEASHTVKVTTRTEPQPYPGGRTPQGLYDMAGNLFQWTATPGRPGRNILKGCSWDDAGGICRGAARHGRKKESRHILIGFRCACGVEGAGQR